MSIERGMGKYDMGHMHNGILLSHKNNGIMPHEATRMELQIAKLSEVSQTERQISYDITSM